MINASHFAGYSGIHLANIAAHVVCGVLALGLGLWILLRTKGDRVHRTSGRAYVVLMSGVVAAATLGFAFFRPDPTLAVITLLVSYQLFSGVRAARGRPPTAMDTMIAALAFTLGAAFLAYLAGGVAAFWRPQVTFPIGAALVFVAGYDLARLAAPRWRARIHPLEHAAKMIATIGGLASAGAGTVLVSLQPLSQIGPSVLFTFVAIGYVALRWRDALRLARPFMSK